ncbi:hypothetical protein C0J52_20634 [Blattella germanica]|nr:hypothetical protein C0J52_20634 [Blattella germanica]
MNFRYSRWTFKIDVDWMQEEYENVIHLDTTNSRWWLFNAAKQEIFRVMKTIILYLKNVDKAAVSLKHLCISPREFEMRKHPNFDNYCPVCMKKDGVFIFRKLMDHNGLMQYKKYYYWVCEDHRKLFFQKPKDYTPPSNDSYIPNIMPEPVKLMKDNANNTILAAGGFCVVTYFVKQP